MQVVVEHRQAAVEAGAGSIGLVVKREKDVNKNVIGLEQEGFAIVTWRWLIIGLLWWRRALLVVSLLVHFGCVVVERMNLYER